MDAYFGHTGVEVSVLESIYSHIQNKLGLEVGTSVVRVKGVRPDDKERQFMNLTNQDFLMRVEQVAYLTDGRTFEYSYADAPETFEFETVITAKAIRGIKIGWGTYSLNLFSVFNIVGITIIHRLL